MIDRRALLTASAALVALPVTARSQSAAAVAQTRHGPVRGAHAGGVAVFKGVRYGQDTGPRRFQPPVAPEAWSDPVDALDYGPACPQRGDEPNQSEDCLFLNVWTPGLDAARRPVMVYIHGGAYSTGSGSSPLYDGTRLARDEDVVVVTRDAEGRVALNQSVNLVTGGAIGGGLWGTLIGLAEHGRPMIGIMDQPVTGERFTGGPDGAFLGRTRLRGNSAAVIRRPTTHSSPRRIVSTSGSSGMADT